MNFLGHLYFSGQDHELMYANLYGDFVKGKDLSAFPEIVSKGIKLHRSIDNYIDTHPVVRALMRELYSELPRISSIAVDVFFDHLLAKNWEHYSERSLREFTDNFYNYTPIHRDFYSRDYLFLIDKMKEGDWIYNYQYLQGVQFACKGLSRRISFPNVLDKAPDILQKKRELIERSFETYMKDAIPYFKEAIDSMNQPL